jgi:hypothetical protein
MNSRFDQITKGLLSLAVILMLTIALVAGQARANLPADAQAAPEPVETVREGLILSADTLHAIESMPHLVGSLVTLPFDLGMCIDALTPESANSGSGDTPVR